MFELIRITSGLDITWGHITEEVVEEVVD